MRLTIVNSTAPGTASLLAPFFQALAENRDVELVVLEQTARKALAEGPGCGSGFRLLPVSTHCYDRRHAAAQVMSRGYRRLLRESRPDVIYVIGEPGYLSTYQVARFARKALPDAKFCLFAAQNIYQRFPPPFASIERWVLAHLDHAFVLGGDHEQVLRRKGYQGPATHLPLGVDTRVFTPQEQPSLRASLRLLSFVAGYVGDFLPARDLPLLIRAVGLCARPVGLLLVGDGPSRADLESQAESTGIGPATRFTGRVPHAGIAAYLNCMDVLVLPSKTIRNRCFGIFRIENAEQFGRVLVEAMACGKPVVGSSCGEIPRVVGESGLIFPEGEAGGLSAALDRLASDPALRARLGQHGLARARTEYDWRVLAERFLTAVAGRLAQHEGFRAPLPSRAVAAATRSRAR